MSLKYFTQLGMRLWLAATELIAGSALAASVRLRLPLLLSLSNPFLEAAPAAALPRSKPAFRPLRPRSTFRLLRRHRRWACKEIDLRQRHLLVQVHDQAVYLDGARAGATQRKHRSPNVGELVLRERPRPGCSAWAPRPHGVLTRSHGRGVHTRECHRYIGVQCGNAHSPNFVQLR